MIKTSIYSIWSLYSGGGLLVIQVLKPLLRTLENHIKSIETKIHDDSDLDKQYKLENWVNYWPDWSKACLEVWKQTINTRFKFLQYKWLIRMYITPVKLHHMSADIPDFCTKGMDEKGSLIHHAQKFKSYGRMSKKAYQSCLTFWSFFVIFIIFSGGIYGEYTFF